MCRDAEHGSPDDYAIKYIDDTRKRVMQWGMRMAFSDKQESFLMAIADKGLCFKQASERRAKA